MGKLLVEMRGGGGFSMEFFNAMELNHQEAPK